MTKRLPPSYLVRQGDKRLDGRYQARRFRERSLRELGWLARAAVVVTALAVAVGGNLVPFFAVASNSYAGVGMYAIVIVAALAQMAIVGWLWLRSSGSAWSKLGWSLKLAVPVLGMLFFAAFYAPPDRLTGTYRNDTTSTYY